MGNNNAKPATKTPVQNIDSIPTAEAIPVDALDVDVDPYPTPLAPPLDGSRATATAFEAPPATAPTATAPPPPNAPPPPPPHAPNTYAYQEQRQNVGRMGANVYVGLGARVHPTAIVGDNCHLGMGVVVGPNARIGCNCHLHAGAKVEEFATIGDNCHLHAGAVVESGATVGSNCHLHMGARVYRGAVVRDNTTLTIGRHVRAVRDPYEADPHAPEMDCWGQPRYRYRGWSDGGFWVQQPFAFGGFEYRGPRHHYRRRPSPHRRHRRRDWGRW